MATKKPKKPARRFVVGKLFSRYVFVHTGGVGTVISASKDFCKFIKAKYDKDDRGPVTIYELVPLAGGRKKP